MDTKQPAAGSRSVVFCSATLNGVSLGAAWSSKSPYLAENASEHAEDAVVDYIEWLEVLNELSSARHGVDQETINLAASLSVKRVLVISGLTASPCSSTPRGDSKVVTTTKKDKAQGCTERLIGLAKRGYVIAINADHYYQGGGAGGKEASIEACEAMKSAGIKVVITKA
jgi:hypothetical protein